MKKKGSPVVCYLTSRHKQEKVSSYTATLKEVGHESYYHVDLEFPNLSYHQKCQELNCLTHYHINKAIEDYANYLTRSVSSFLYCLHVDREQLTPSVQTDLNLWYPQVGWSIEQELEDLLELKRQLELILLICFHSNQDIEVLKVQKAREELWKSVDSHTGRGFQALLMQRVMKLYFRLVYFDTEQDLEDLPLQKIQME